ncbi:Uncharacterized protein Fot_01098 [Forsythia ovata]|uniref:Uncharacterized protein n=1 Tax=Forsythia ovata TaxID=205694 RepID=A0ABD1X329_9LAMI
MPIINENVDRRWLRPRSLTAALIEEHSTEGVRKRPSRHTKIYEDEFGEEFIDAIKKKYFSYTLSLSTTARRRINGTSKDLLVMHPYENKTGNIGNNLRLRWKPAVSGLAAIVTGSSPPQNCLINLPLMNRNSTLDNKDWSEQNIIVRGNKFLKYCE